jgi:predicted RND superfamily exporter protein
MRTSAPQREESSLLRGLLRIITRFVSRRARLTTWVVVAMTCAAAGLTVREMSFRSKRAELIDPRTDFHRQWTRYTKSFDDEPEIVVAIESERAEVIERALDDLGSRMENEPELFSNVLYKVNASSLFGKGLQSLTPNELYTGLARLNDYTPVLQGRWELLKLDSLVDRLRLQIRSRSQNKSRDAAAPLWRHAELLATSISNNFDDQDAFRSPWPPLLPSGGYLRAGSAQRVQCLHEPEKIGYLRAVPVRRSSDVAGASASISRLRELIAEVSPEHPDVHFGITGLAAIENDEWRQSQFDMLIAAGLAFVGVALVLFFAFRSFRLPLAAMLMLAVGLAWACAYATLVVGHLNSLSISFASVLIGLGIVYSIHYLARYVELRHQGEDLRPALIKASTSRGPAILASAVTTALAFFAATCTEFLGVAELAIIAGGAILICALATFVVLPALVAVFDRDVELRNIPAPFEANFVRNLTARYPMSVMLVSLAIVIGLSLQIVRVRDWRIEPRIRYDQNAASLQASRTESVETQERMFQKTNDSLLYAVAVADSADEARALRSKFEALPTVHHVDDLASRGSAQSNGQSRQLLQTYQARLSGIPRTPVRISNPDPARVGHALEQLYLLARRSGDPLAGKVENALNQFLDKFESLNLSEQTSFLSQYQQRAVTAIHAQFAAMRDSSNPEPIRAKDVPATLTSRFRGADGKWLLQVYPREQIWDDEPLSKFVADLRTVDPRVTGAAVERHESARQIRSSYLDASMYALAVICVVLLIDFLDTRHKVVALAVPLAVIGFAIFTLHARRAEIHLAMLAMAYLGMTAAIAAFLDFRQCRDALLAVLPPIGGYGLTFGVLALFGLNLNPANMIVLPLLLGIGVDQGVHILHDFRGQSEGKYRASESTIKAIVLTSLTTMIGFGSVMAASHRGLRSMGVLLTVGIASCLFISLVLLPAILSFVSRGPAASGESKRKTESLESKPSASAAPRPPQRKAA